jgi:hypothetical protein
MLGLANNNDLITLTWPLGEVRSSARRLSYYDYPNFGGFKADDRQ